MLEKNINTALEEFKRITKEQTKAIQKANQQDDAETAELLRKARDGTLLLEM